MCESKSLISDLTTRANVPENGNVKHAEKFKYIHNILVADKNSDINNTIIKNNKIKCYTLLSRENLLK